MKSSRANLALDLDGTEVRTSEQRTAAFRKAEEQIKSPKAAKAKLRSSESDDAECGDSEERERIDAANALKAELLREAFALSRLEIDEAAYLCRVSRSLVEKWLKADTRACPNLIQMLLLPLAFHVALNRVMNKRFGFGRAALARIQESLGDLAAVME